jgi:hypothetical protein
MRITTTALLITALAACVDGTPGPGGDDDELQNPVRDVYDEWIKVEPEGAVCGDGSQYKFFVNYSNQSDDLVFVLEPGGACWDFESCTGQAGIRGAANPNGIPDDHYELAPFISPFLQRNDVTTPTHDFNMVYVPYCTGDVHTGNNVIEYDDPLGEQASVTFHHAGHDNMQKVISWVDGQFTHVPRMLVTGCSAGGAGSITNYYFIRNGITAAEQGYLIDDSGPIFPSDGFSGPLHTKIRASWNVDSILTELPAGFDPEDFGTINTALADEFPDDRLATTYFRRDMNFSLYSYERFYGEPWPTKDEVMEMWESDTQRLLDVYGSRDNLYYYIPYWRALNDSHCTTLISFPGSEIQDHDMDLDTWVKAFIDDERAVESAIEAPVPGEDEDPE